MIAKPAPVNEDTVWQLLSKVPDPEIPVLSIIDLGIVRWVRIATDEVHVGIAPTYIGCPATEVIANSVVHALAQDGLQATVKPVLSPPWSTDWISDAGREKLRAYGIAPPADTPQHEDRLPVACPRCASVKTQKVSQFGSTPCKASYKCSDCLEPFEYFKCI